MAYVATLRDEATKADVDTLVFRRAKDGRALSIKSMKRSWRSALRAVGLDGQHTWHNTKATFVTLVARHAPAAVVQQMARHASFSTTQRYPAVADHAKKDAAKGVAESLAAAGIPLRSKSRQQQETAVKKPRRPRSTARSPARST